MQNDELLPCPFCGGEAELVKYSHREYTPTYGVRCKGFCIKQYDYESEEGAIKHWNIRKPMERIVEQLEGQMCKCVTYKDGYAQGWNNGVQEAVAIVRNGGKE